MTQFRSIELPIKTLERWERDFSRNESEWQRLENFYLLYPKSKLKRMPKPSKGLYPIFNDYIKAKWYQKVKKGLHADMAWLISEVQSTLNNDAVMNHLKTKMGECEKDLIDDFSGSRGWCYRFIVMSIFCFCVAA